MQQNGPFRGAVNTIEVADTNAAIAKVKANGGEMIFEKDIIPGVGYLAYFKENMEIIVGPRQVDPQAGVGG